MIRKLKLIADIPVADMYAGYPLARKIFGAALVVFALYNFFSWLGSITSYPLYVRWLEASQPFADIVAVVFPGIDSATAYLKAHNGSYMIPVTRNLLSIDFALLLILPSCVAVIVCVDFLRSPRLVSARVREIFKRVRMPIGEIGLRSLMMLMLIFVPLYFGLISDPLVMGFTETVAYYVVVFGFGMLYFLISVCCFLSLIVLKMRPPSPPTIDASRP